MDFAIETHAMCYNATSHPMRGEAGVGGEGDVKLLLVELLPMLHGHPPLSFFQAAIHRTEHIQPFPPDGTSLQLAMVFHKVNPF